MSSLDIEYDRDMEREYIPLAGGFEFQTKGKGSTVRLLMPNGERCILPEYGGVAEDVEAMARAQNISLAQHKQVIAELVAAADEVALKDLTHMESFGAAKHASAVHRAVRLREAIARAKALEVA